MANKNKKSSGKQGDTLLELLNSRLNLAKRFGKKWTDNVKKWEKDYQVETLNQKLGSTEGRIDSLDNHLQVPYIFSTIESTLPVVFETVPSIIMKQRGKEDRDFSDFSNIVWDHVKEKVGLEEKVETVGQAFLITGLGEVNYGWSLETEEVEEKIDQPILNEDGSPLVGADGIPVVQTVIAKVRIPIKDLPYIETCDYNSVWFSPESKFVMDDEENLIPYLIYGSIRTPDAIERIYGKRPSGNTHLDLKEIDPNLNKAEDEKEFLMSDLERSNLYRYYGNLTKAVSGDRAWREDKVYHTVFTTTEILKEPEAIEKKPFIQIGNYGLPFKFQRFGEPKILRELEQDISLGRSRIMDLRDKQGTKIALPQGVEVDENALKRAGDFVVMRFIGNQLPAYITPPPIPETIITALQMSKEDFQMASAQLDISRGGQQAMVGTATGQKMFQESFSKRIERKRKKIAKLIKYLAKNLLVLCANNWTIEVFAKITDMSVEEIQQNGYIEKLKDLGNDYDIDIDIESGTSNKEAQSAQSIALYREIKDDPMVNRGEVLKQVFKIGFGIKDPDRFINGDFTPDQILKMFEYLVQIGVMDGQHAQEMVLSLRNVLGVENQPAGKEGRPATSDPTSIINKAMPGSDSNQMSAQAGAAYKQQGVAKGPQGS